MVRELWEFENLQGTVHRVPFKLNAFEMFGAGMLQQSSGGLNKRPLGIARLPNSQFFPLSAGSSSWGLGRTAKSGSLSSISSGSDCVETAGADPDYIMQLVNDVRRFADVLLHLKEAFNAKGKSCYWSAAFVLGCTVINLSLSYLFGIQQGKVLFGITMFVQQLQKYKKNVFASLHF